MKIIYINKLLLIQLLITIILIINISNISKSIDNNSIKKQFSSKYNCNIIKISNNIQKKTSLKCNNNIYCLKKANKLSNLYNIKKLYLKTLYSIFDKSYIYGNINNKSLIELSNSEEYNKYNLKNIFKKNKVSKLNVLKSFINLLKPYIIFYYSFKNFLESINYLNTKYCINYKFYLLNFIQTIKFVNNYIYNKSTDLVFYTKNIHLHKISKLQNNNVDIYGFEILIDGNIADIIKKDMLITLNHPLLLTSNDIREYISNNYVNNKYDIQNLLIVAVKKVNKYCKGLAYKLNNKDYTFITKPYLTFKVLLIENLLVKKSNNKNIKIINLKLECVKFPDKIDYVNHLFSLNIDKIKYIEHINNNKINKTE